MIKRGLPFLLLCGLAGGSLAGLPLAAQAAGSPFVGVAPLQGVRTPQGVTRAESALLQMKSAGGDAKTSPIQGIREKAIRESAETYGAQSGYRWEALQLRAWADARKSDLDAAYDFASLLLDGGRVIPPVIEEDQASFRQEGRDVAVTAQTTWRILREARIVSTAPNWRTWLYLSAQTPLAPNPVLLPRDAKDESAWHSGIRRGWAMGVKEAIEAEKLAMHRMTRDYAGMLRFWLLKRRGVMSAPLLSSGAVAIRVNGRTLSVDERIFRLTDPGHFVSPKKWTPVIRLVKN